MHLRPHGQGRAVGSEPGGRPHFEGTSLTTSVVVVAFVRQKRNNTDNDDRDMLISLSQCIACYRRPGARYLGVAAVAEAKTTFHVTVEFLVEPLATVPWSCVTTFMPNAPHIVA